MDPFTQRMLERAKARREKLETKVPVEELSRPRKVLAETENMEKTLSIGDDVNAVQINIVHQNNVQVEVQVEEREITLSDYLKEKENKSDAKTRLQKLGKLYSGDGRLSSPIQQSKEIVIPDNTAQPSQAKTKKFGRLAALADQINNWEDDLTHHQFKKETNEKTVKNVAKSENNTAPPNKPINNVSSQSNLTNNASSPSKLVNNPSSLRKSTNNTSSPSKFSENTSSPSKFVNKFSNNTSSPSKFSNNTSSPSKFSNNTSSPSKFSSNISSPSKFTNISSPSKFSNISSPSKSGPFKQPAPNQKDKVSALAGKFSAPADDKFVKVMPVKKVPFQPQVVGTSPKGKGNWDDSILEDLEAQGFRRASEGRSRLVYNFFGGMAAACAPPLDRKPSAKKRAAPPPPQHPPPPPPPANGEQCSSGDSSPYGTPEGDRRRDPLHMSVREKKAMFEKGGRAARILDPRPKHIVPVHAARAANGVADQSERPKFNRMNSQPDLNVIEPDTQEEDPSSESSPLMGNDALKASTNNLSAIRPAVVLNQPAAADRRNSIDSPLVVATLEEVKRIKVATPKPGGLYPCLADIEAQSEEERLSCPASDANSSSDSAANENCDDWGNTSFGRDVLQAVGVTPNKSILKTPLKSKYGVRNEPAKKCDDSSDESFGNDNLDDLLDEAFEDDIDTDGPTPPKQNKNLKGTKTSNSFHYKRGSDNEKNIIDTFKSPLKTPPEKTGRPSIIDFIGEGKKPLTHTVSFYRKQQMEGSQPSTPLRIVRMDTEEVDEEDKEKAKQRAQLSAQESHRRVKELLEEVSKQNAIIQQASQALNLCQSTIEFSGSTEQAEGERLLLLASHRRQACLHEVQRIQVEGTSQPSSHTYTLRLEEICFPLRREYVRQLNAEGAVGHYLACLIKCQERVLSTSLVKTDPDSFAITFPDKFRLEGLDGNFKITLEAYALQASKEILPHDIKYHIATKKSGKLATPRKGVRGADLKAPPPMASPGGPSVVRTPAMQPQGYCIFSAQQINRTNFTLNKTHSNGPLEGCIRLKIHGDKRASQLAPTTVRRGFLTMFEEAGGLGAWHRRWCVLHSGDLSYWRYPDDEKKKMPMGSIELAAAVSETVGPAPRDLCARPHTLLLETKADTCPDDDQSARSLIMVNGRRRYLLAADTRPEREAWAKALNDTLLQVRDLRDDD